MDFVCVSNIVRACFDLALQEVHCRLPSEQVWLYNTYTGTGIQTRGTRRVFFGDNPDIHSTTKRIIPLVARYNSRLFPQYSNSSMLRFFAGSFKRLCLLPSARFSSVLPAAAEGASSSMTKFGSVSFSSSTLSIPQPPPTLSLEDMPFLHHGKRPRYRDYEKFRSPRRRASKLYAEITQEAIQKSKESKPKVWNTHFRVGDAIEIEAVEEGGIKASATEKMRGVVLGIFRKGLDHSVLIRDVVFGEPVETRVPLHSPLLRSIKILEKNFVHKGKKKIKRAKLYYLSNRNPLGKIFPFLRIWDWFNL